MNIAYIGLGNMGGAMAGRLLERGRRITVHDLEPRLVANAVANGATAADDAARAAANAEIVSICVPAADHVDAVLDAMGDALRPGLTVLVHSTISPDQVRPLAEKAAAAGAALHDVCVAGGSESAEIGELALLVGGLGELSAPARELLDDYGNMIVDAGPVGSGAAVKLMINVMTYAQIAAVAIGHDAVTTVGGDATSLFDALRHLGMLGTIADRYTTLLSIDRADLGGFADFLGTQAYNAQKDLSLARELPGVDARSHELLEILGEAMPTYYRATDPGGD